MKIGMHVSVVESGERGVVMALEGETATIRMRNADKTLSTESRTLALTALKGEKGRPVDVERLLASEAAAAAPAVSEGEGAAPEAAPSAE